MFLQNKEECSLNIEIICIGNLKEKYWKAAVDEYSSRLSKYGKLKITEIKETKLPGKAGSAEELKVVEKEGISILNKLKERSYIVALDINGKPMSSEDLAVKLESIALSGYSHVIFIIGGSLGLSNQVLKKADLRLSFSSMTFPHQMMRVILLEQLYRANKINNNETYHK